MPDLRRAIFPLKGQFHVLVASRGHATPKSALGLQNHDIPPDWVCVQCNPTHNILHSSLPQSTPSPHPPTPSLSHPLSPTHSPPPSAYPCQTYNKPYTRNLGGSPCSNCGLLIHYTKRCSGITRSQRVPKRWFCKKFGPAATTNTATPQPPNSASTPTTQSQLPITTTSQPLTPLTPQQRTPSYINPVPSQNQTLRHKTLPPQTIPAKLAINHVPENWVESFVL